MNALRLTLASTVIALAVGCSAPASHIPAKPVAATSAAGQAVRTVIDIPGRGNGTTVAFTTTSTALRLRYDYGCGVNGPDAPNGRMSVALVDASGAVVVDDLVAPSRPASGVTPTSGAVIWTGLPAGSYALRVTDGSNCDWRMAVDG